MRRLVAYLATGFLAATACVGGPSTSGPSSSGPSSTSASSVALGNIKVGAIFPLSGSVASAGVNAFHGAELAVDVLNGKYPQIDLAPLTVGKVELKSVDSQGDPQNGAADVDRLVDTDKVVAVTGAYQSAVTLTASERAERLGLPFVDAASGAASLRDRGLKWWVRAGRTALDSARTYFAWLKSIQNQHPVKTVSVIHQNDAAGNDFATATKDEAGRNGVTIADDISFQSNATDLTSQVQRLRSANPDAVFSQMFINDTSLFLKTMSQLGYTPPALLATGGGWDDPTFMQVVGSLGRENVRVVTWGIQVTEKNPVAKAVDEQFFKNYSVHLNGDSARAFTAMITLGQAIQAAKSTEPEKIRQALQNTNVTKTIMPWAGIKFDSRGQNTLAAYLVLQLVKVDWQILYPKEMQTAEPIWPMSPLTGR
jgi:branched-chain amino acid transport system substrate-binding protein